MERFQVLADKKFIYAKKSSRLVLTFGIWRLFQEFSIHNLQMLILAMHCMMILTTRAGTRVGPEVHIVMYAHVALEVGEELVWAGFLMVCLKSLLPDLLLLFLGAI